MLDSIWLSSIHLKQTNFHYAYFSLINCWDFNDYLFKIGNDIVLSNLFHIETKFRDISFDPESKTLCAYRHQGLPFDIHVDGLKTKLKLFEDEKRQNKILTVTGNSIWYSNLPAQDVENLMRFFGDQYKKTVYFRLETEHPLLPQFSTKTPQDGSCEIHRPAPQKPISPADFPEDAAGLG